MGAEGRDFWALTGRGIAESEHRQSGGYPALLCQLLPSNGHMGKASAEGPVRCPQGSPLCAWAAFNSSPPALMGIPSVSLGPCTDRRVGTVP